MGQHGPDFGEACGSSRCARRPEHVSDYDGASQLALGEAHTLVLRDGRVLTRGRDDSGQLGLGPGERDACTVGGETVPRCAVDLSGKLACEGTTTVPEVALACRSALSPTSLEGATWVRATLATSCMGNADGSTWCAGILHDLAPVADACGKWKTPCAPTPLRLPHEAVADVRTGTTGGCVLGGDGRLSCSGGKYARALDGLEHVRAIAVGHEHSCAIKEEGTLWCGGWNAEGQIGNGDILPPASAPVPPTRVLARVTRVRTSSSTTCAIDNHERVFCWGRNETGQAGQGHQRLFVTTPALVKGLPPIVDLAFANESVCALAKDGGVWCWGDDSLGQLGLGKPASETCTHGALSKGKVPCATTPQRQP